MITVSSNLEIKKIDESYSEKLLTLLLDSKEEYSKYFIPFEYNFHSVYNSLSIAKLDRYFGVFINEELNGFYMLRGLDKGYEIPSYGVWINKKFSNRGLGKLTLLHAISYCKLNNIPKLMLKVHPDNFYARKMYIEAGFKQTGIDEHIGHLIFHKIIKI